MPNIHSKCFNTFHSISMIDKCKPSTIHKKNWRTTKHSCKTGLIFTPLDQNHIFKWSTVHRTSIKKLRIWSATWGDWWSTKNLHTVDLFDLVEQLSNWHTLGKEAWLPFSCAESAKTAPIWILKVLSIQFRNPLYKLVQILFRDIITARWKSKRNVHNRFLYGRLVFSKFRRID